MNFYDKARIHAKHKLYLPIENAFSKLGSNTMSFGMRSSWSGLKGLNTLSDTFVSKVFGLAVSSPRNIYQGIKSNTDFIVDAYNAINNSKTVNAIRTGLRSSNSLLLGNKPLFHHTINAEYLEHQYLGKSVRDISPTKFTFNETLRRRIGQGAVAMAALGSLRAVTSYRDPQTKVYDQTRTMNADGNLALSMYYNNK